MTKETKKRFHNKKLREYLFIYGLLAYPLLNFIVFYVVKNVNSVLMAFQSTDSVTYVSTWVGFENFRRIGTDLFRNKALLGYVGRSAMFWLVTTAVGMPLNVLFAYLFMIKMRGTPIIRFGVMVPTIISGLVTAMLFSKFAENALPIAFEKLLGIKTVSLLRDERFNFQTIVVYMLLTGFSYNILIYMNGMKGAGESLFEVARLEGATHLQTIRYVCLPSVYPIMMTFLVTSVPGILCGDPGLYVFYAYDAPDSVITSGYYLFIKTKNSDSSVIDYSYAAAMGLMFTAVSLPLTLGVRKLMDRLDPNNERPEKKAREAK